MVTTMDIKWKCKNCDSINHTAEGEPRKCFVCGYLNDSRFADSMVCPTPAAARTEPSLLDRIKRWFGMSASAASPHEEAPTDWKISSSAEDERNAYVTAEPVYSAREAIPAAPTAPVLPTLPHTDTAASVVSDDTDSATTAAAAGGTDEPWPEHHVRFRMDKLCDIGCTGIARDELNGIRGYRLTLSGGATRYMTINNMRMSGYAENI